MGRRPGLDPFNAFCFAIELDGTAVAHFQEISGIGTKTDIFEIKEGGLNSLIHKFATRVSSGDITFKRGFIADPVLYDWMDGSTLELDPPRLNGSIVMFDENRTEVCRWNFFKAFPLKWEGPGFNATASGYAISSLTVATEWVELEFAEVAPDPPVEPPKPVDPPEPEEPEPVEDHEGIVQFNRNGTDPDNTEFGPENQAEINATCDAIEEQIEQEGSATCTVIGRNSNATLTPAEQRWAAEHTVQPRLDNTQAAIEAELARRGTDFDLVEFVQSNAGNAQAVAQSGGGSSDAGTHNRAVDINVTGP